MLQSPLATSIFNQFSSNYQTYSQDQNPFVYVDQNGNIKLLTDVVNDNGSSNGIFAVSVAEDGWMEFLSLNE